jgi:carbonic anhydrase/acetyltransferase-like protein (isoleucine patch superfamily)
MKTEMKSDVFRFMHEAPRFGKRVFVDPAAVVSGDVSLGDDASVWPMAVVRGDVNRIVIGARCNIQDGSVLHVTHESAWQPDGLPLLLGDDVTVGHAAVLHACTIGARCLIGMGAIVMDGAVVEPDAMIAGGAVVTPGKVVESGTLWRGNPARFARDLSEREIERLLYSARHYVRLKDSYLEGQA